MRKFKLMALWFSLGALFLLGVRNFAFKQIPSAQKKQEIIEQGPQIEKLDEVVREKIATISLTEVLAPKVKSQEEKLLYFDLTDNLLVEIDPDGQDKKKTELKIDGQIKEIFWNHSGESLMVKVSAAEQVEYFYFEKINIQGQKLSLGIEALAWTPLGDKLVYKTFDTVNKKRLLKTTDPQGKQVKELFEVPFREVQLAVIPRSPEMAFWNKPRFGEETSLNLFNPLGGTPKEIFKGKYAADYLWSPAGNKALVSFTENPNSSSFELGVLDFTGQLQKLNFPGWANKCVWSNDATSIFCALPGEIPAEAKLPDDYLEKKFYTQDTFWKLNLVDGKRERLLEIGEIKERFDANDLLLSPTQSRLYFRNRIDGRLWGIRL